MAIWLFFLPGIILHEAAHLVPALLMGRVESFSVVPSITKQGMTLGQVVYVSRSSWDRMIVSIAPVCFRVFLLWWLRSLGVLAWEMSGERLSLAVDVAPLWQKDMASILKIYCILQLWWAGKVSWQDMKVFFQATWMWWLAGMAGFLAWRNFVQW